MNQRAFAITALLALCLFLTPAGAQRLDTVAEKSNFTATSRHADVLDFCERLAKQSPLVRLAELGTTHEGRKLPLVILADPPVSTPEEAAKSGKLVVFAMGNIHAGEVDGKEALLMLARDLALAKERPLLKDLILVFAPNFNADGGEKVGKNRPHQAGPDEVGTRTNAQGFDLNRDFVKLETPEVQALARFFRRWDPAVFIDLHTTNGSYHRYTLTYDGPRHPSNPPALTEFVRDTLLPDVGKRLEKATGYRSYFYGNFGRGPGQSRWETTPGQPRYGFHYAGFRNRIGILSETYVYAPYRDRVLASRDFTRACLEFVAEQKDRVRSILSAADRATHDAAPGSPVALRHRLAPLGDKVTILALEGGKTAATGGKARDVPAEYHGRAEATLSVGRPYAYLIPARFSAAVENLQRHGIDVEVLREDVELNVEAYRVEKVTTAKPFQKHSLVSIEVAPRKESRRVEAGTVLVHTSQRLGNLAAFLLEPQSEDGLLTWNFFDAGLKAGQDYPVLRLPARVPLVTTKARPLAEDRGPRKTVTPQMLDDGTLPNFRGDPVTVTWLDDGEYFLQEKEGELLKVHAMTGRSEPYRGLESEIPELHVAGPREAAPQKGKGKPLPGGRELLSTLPGGKGSVFVRNGNLYVEDGATKKERALTADGGDLIRNGKASWVYFEEVFNRSWKTYWTSADGSHVAFLRTDEAGVPKATVVDYTKVPQIVEVTAYPRAGEPNPHVKLGIVPVAGGAPRYADLGAYTNKDGEAFLITQVGWLPDNQTVYFCVQDRAQTWLDFCTVGAAGGKPTKLFRDTTRAWVEPPLRPRFLKDGSFLVTSERTGWKHIYRYAPGAWKGLFRYEGGGELKPVTSGEWEVRSLDRVDEEGGWVYFSGTKGRLTARNPFRVKLDGTGLEPLMKGKGKGETEVQFSPRGDLFVSTWSDIDTPPQVRLHRADGTLVRTLDNNPIFVREEFQQGGFERLQIKTPDGFLLEASVQKPANFDPQKKYPVWFMTYGGPHAPSVSDGFGKGRGPDEALANAGYIVFRGDPRSASGKGAISTWTIYRQMGVQELKDIETMIEWITKHPWADATRVGMSGHSFGGYITAYALTHSKRFAAGASGAPVTDWRLYDSIYTERYMDTPQKNPRGYDITSAVKGAKNLHGRLLLGHGVKDDNVHVGNTLQLANALQQAGKDFEMMLYPLNRHGLGAPYSRLQRDFMRRVLQPVP